MAKILDSVITPPPQTEADPSVDQDQLAREKIPSREDLPTQYHPLANLLMVIPLPTIGQIGSIILPGTSVIQLNEGHVVERGPDCKSVIAIGDCVTWDAQSEYKMKIDGVAFVLVKENCCTMYIPKAELENATLARIAD